MLSGWRSIMGIFDFLKSRPVGLDPANLPATIDDPADLPARASTADILRIMRDKKESKPIAADAANHTLRIIKEKVASLKNTTFHVTLWPAFPHFKKFARDDERVQGIRLNSAMMAASEIDSHFEQAIKAAKVPLWFDIKGMQMRIREVICDHHFDHLEFILNRPIQVKTPCIVNFKGGEDAAKLIEVKDGGTHLIFEGGPKNEVRAGESIHIRHPSLKVGGETFLKYELEKIAKIVSLGFTRYYLSYVYDQKHVDEFRELIGNDAELILKIENKEALDWVANKYQKQPNTNLMTARGDLYVEVEYPHDILKATELVIEKEPDAFVGSRMLLSCVTQSTPSCADFSDLAYLHKIGYRNFLLCDELCLKEDLLGRATNVFSAFRKDYCGK